MDGYCFFILVQCFFLPKSTIKIFYNLKRYYFYFYVNIITEGDVMKNIIVKLVKIANDMDALGMHEEADEVTKVAKEMHEDGDREAAGMINLNTDQVQKQRKVNIDQKNIDNSVKKVNTLKDF